MINIEDKHDCCGCTACVEKCPTNCISMQVDEEGFFYPQIDETKCIQCNLCERVCPVKNQRVSSLPVVVYAAKHKDDGVVTVSSSGGVFTALATNVLKKGGVVFGASFNEKWDVVLTFTETIAGLKAFQGSKYVQCAVGNSYKEAEDFLKKGRTVLFSGTPCQISGLNFFLRNEYKNLITVSVICHGVPSPGIWNEYKKQIPAKLVAGKKTILPSLKSLPVITSINCRDKTDGWKKYSFSVTGSAVLRESKKTVSSPVVFFFREYYKDNIYLRGFLDNLYLRPSCYQCPARKGKSGADIQLGDYWGVKRRTPNFYDPNGVSLVLIYTEKGCHIFNELDVFKTEISYDDVMDCNPNVERDEIEPLIRTAFYKRYNQLGFKAIPEYCDKIEGRDLKWHIKKYLSNIIHNLKK